MAALVFQCIIVVIICGFVWWAYQLLIGALPAAPFAGLLNALVLILLGAIVVFYAIIPLIKALSAVVKF